MSDKVTPKCATCDVALQSHVADPQSDDMLFCPTCGVSDTLENVVAEVQEYVTEQAGDHLFSSLQRSTKDSKFVTVSKKPRPKKTYRFKANINLQS
jgi:hypothetical protein